MSGRQGRPFIDEGREDGGDMLESANQVRSEARRWVSGPVISGEFGTPSGDFCGKPKLQTGKEGRVLPVYAILAFHTSPDLTLLCFEE